MTNDLPTKTDTGTALTTPLHLDVEDVRKDLGLIDPKQLQPDPAVDSELEQRARTYADRLAALDPKDFKTQDEARAAVEAMGRELQGEAAHQSRMLKQAIAALGEQGAEGGPVAKALVDLKFEVEKLDPHKFDFSAGWFTRLLGGLPGVGTPLKRYFSRFESAQTILDALVNSLEQGRDQLKRDNLTLQEDQRAMRELTRKLETQIKLAQLVDQGLHYKLEREIPADDPRHGFIQEELLFPLRQRLMDLQQQLAVNQQGVLATGLVMRNNQELVRGVNRSLDVTVGALNVAVTTALALANQKIVLDKVSAVNRTTSDLIRGTAERLRSQGAEIQTQAAGTMIDMQALKGAFADIHAALDEISQYRRDALPTMAATILEFDQLATEAETKIRKNETGDRLRPELNLDA